MGRVYASAMALELSEQEIRLILKWAEGCDGESYIDDDDWPLIERLAAAVGVNPRTVAPSWASEVRDREIGFEAAYYDFKARYGRSPGPSEAMALRDQLGARYTGSDHAR